MSTPFFAADVGNSRIKIGRFDRARSSTGPLASDPSSAQPKLPQPVATLQLPLRARDDCIRSGQLVEEWLAPFAADGSATWLVASVNRAHARWLEETVTTTAPGTAFHRLTHREMPLAIHVDAPERVGLDRLAGAVAAGHLRDDGRAAIVVDFGTAITVDLVSAEGAFEGGAILPGIAMAAEALESKTDALPHSPLSDLTSPPAPVGKSTLHAIEAGLLWGAVGAVRELIERIAATCERPPQVFVTGGASPSVVPLLQSRHAQVVHVPELVLAGIAIVAERYAHDAPD